MPKQKESYAYVVGGKLWYRTSGDGSPTLFCHGGPGLWDYLRPLSVLMPDARVCVFEQRGCGRSSASEQYSAQQSVEDVEQLRVHLGWPVMSVVGHSWGAELALRYALDYPSRVAAIVYIGGTGFQPDYRSIFDVNQRARLGEKLPRWEWLKSHVSRSPDEDRELWELQWSAEFASGQDRMACAAEIYATRPSGCRVNLVAAAQINATRCDVYERLVDAASLDVPVLAMHGIEDPRPPYLVQDLVDRLPTVESVLVPLAGHFPWVEQPSVVADALRGFLARHCV